MRQFYNLFSQQHFFGTVIPVVGLPAIGYIMMSDFLVERGLFSRFAKYDEARPVCTTCYELRGSILQATAAVVLPYVLSVFACSAAAISYRTYPTPHLNDCKKMLLTIRRTSRSLGTTLTMLALANLAFAGSGGGGDLEVQPISVNLERCPNCAAVLTHLLSDYLGVKDFCIDSREGTVSFLNSLNVQEAASIASRFTALLRASGFTVISPPSNTENTSVEAKNDLIIVPSIAVGEAGNCSASPALDGAAKLSPLANQVCGPYVTRVQNLVAALGPEYRCLRGHYVPAWCLRLPSGGPLIGSLISVLSSLRPLSRQLLHLKRVHSVTEPANGGNRSVRVLLDLNKVQFSHSHALQLRDQLAAQLNLDEPDVSLQVEPCWVPLFKALSRRQHDELVRQAKEVDFQTAKTLGWPSTFHPDPQLELLLAVGSDAPVTYFTNEETAWHNKWLERVVQLAETRGTVCASFNTSCAGPSGPPCAAIVLPPRSDNKEACSPLAETVSFSERSRLQHAVMLAVEEVGRTQRVSTSAKRRAEEEVEAGYICTDCDVYLSSEPCVMCAMALVHSRVRRLFVARRLPGLGGIDSGWAIHRVKNLNHRFLAFLPPAT
ncbi:adenosine deaminase, tRNA-specific 3 [Sparganum proliferum]